MIVAKGGGKYEVKVIYDGIEYTAILRFSPTVSLKLTKNLGLELYPRVIVWSLIYHEIAKHFTSSDLKSIRQIGTKYSPDVLTGEMIHKVVATLVDGTTISFDSKIHTEGVSLSISLFMINGQHPKTEHQLNLMGLAFHHLSFLWYQPDWVEKYNGVLHPDYGPPTVQTISKE